MKVNWSVMPPEREMIDMARRMMARCRPARMSSRSSPSASRSRSSAPASSRWSITLMRRASGFNAYGREGFPRGGRVILIESGKDTFTRNNFV